MGEPAAVTGQPQAHQRGMHDFHPPGAADRARMHAAMIRRSVDSEASRSRNRRGSQPDRRPSTRQVTATCKPVSNFGRFRLSWRRISPHTKERR